MASGGPSVRGRQESEGTVVGEVPFVRALFVIIAKHATTLALHPDIGDSVWILKNDLLVVPFDVDMLGD